MPGRSEPRGIVERARTEDDGFEPLVPLTTETLFRDPFSRREPPALFLPPLPVHTLADKQRFLGQDINLVHCCGLYELKHAQCRNLAIGSRAVPCVGGNRFKGPESNWLSVR